MMANFTWPVQMFYVLAMIYDFIARYLQAFDTNLGMGFISLLIIFLQRDMRLKGSTVKGSFPTTSEKVITPLKQN